MAEQLDVVEFVRWILIAYCHDMANTNEAIMSQECHVDRAVEVGDRIADWSVEDQAVAEGLLVARFCRHWAQLLEGEVDADLEIVIDRIKQWALAARDRVGSGAMTLREIVEL